MCTLRSTTRDQEDRADDEGAAGVRRHSGLTRLAHCRPAAGSMPPVYVVMVASECAQVAQAGGLADVVFGLSRELELRGHAVEIVLPKYDCMRDDRVYGLTPSYERLEVPWNGGAIKCTVWFGFVDGRKCFFIEPHSRERFFERGDVYGSSDDVARFAFFSKAALEFMLQSDKRPDVIHCHDWQTGLVPVLLYELYQHAGMSDQRVVYTIHNIAHQGVSGEWALALTGLGPPERFFQPERMLDNHNPFALNIMKGAIVYANFVTTVSPHYAWEVRHSDMGMGLGQTLHAHEGKFGGILNGVNYDTWNPEVDSLIPRRYGADSIDDKQVNRRALRDRFLLRDVERPIVAYIGRLDFQKGIHLIHHALYYALDAGAQFVLLGSSPDPAVHEHFQHQRRHLNDNPDCHLELGFSAELAHLMYAGADLLVMPSVFEPCGLAQMIAMKYGTVPMVRAVGGLAATVFDRDHSPRPLEERNGFVFDHVDPPALESAMGRAIDLWRSDPDEFRALQLNGMRADRSWAEPGRRYLEVYEHVKHR
jgi:starch synthase